jgi:hypothetical protein
VASTPHLAIQLTFLFGKASIRVRFRNGALIVKRIKTTQKQRDADGISRDQDVGAAETLRIVAAPTPV